VQLLRPSLFEVNMAIPLVLGTLLVRDEEEIVLECIEHHIKHGVDGFIVTDNGSKDSTRDILAQCPHVFAIIDEPAHTHHQSKWVTRMARLAHQRNADWVVHIDADEFWYGLELLKYKTSLQDVGKIIVLNEYKHHPMPRMEFGTFERSQMPYYHRVRKPMPKVIHRPSSRATISHGNHFVSGTYGKTQTRKDIIIHHYPVRSYGHFLQKTINGGTALKKHPGSISNGKRWRKWYDRYKEGKLPELYDEFVLTPERLEQGLADGTLKKQEMY
jgi:hypothetical protein